METESEPIEERDISNCEVLENISDQYVEYLEIDSKKEQEKFNETVEEMLTKLDEFCTLVDMVRGDTSINLSETLPKIQAKCEDMRKTFQRIDKLEEFVSVVRDNIAAMEDCVNKAEDHMGTFSGLKKMLSSFVSSKKTSTKDDKGPKFEPPPIFKTSEYLVNVTPSAKDQNKSETVKSTQVDQSGTQKKETEKVSQDSNTKVQETTSEKT